MSRTPETRRSPKVVPEAITLHRGRARECMDGERARFSTPCGAAARPEARSSADGPRRHPRAPLREACPRARCEHERASLPPLAARTARRAPRAPGGKVQLWKWIAAHAKRRRAKAMKHRFPKGKTLGDRHSGSARARNASVELHAKATRACASPGENARRAHVPCRNTEPAGTALQRVRSTVPQRPSTSCPKFVPGFAASPKGEGRVETSSGGNLALGTSFALGETRNGVPASPTSAP
jgi:hypothetical protein